MKEKTLKQIGLLIKDARMSKHISQEELAWGCGITKNGLGKIELGKSNAKLTTLIKIFSHLGVDRKK